MSGIRGCFRAAAGIVLGFAAGAAFAQVTTIPGAVEQTGQQQITRDTLRAPIRFLSADLL